MAYHGRYAQGDRLLYVECVHMTATAATIQCSNSFGP